MRVNVYGEEITSRVEIVKKAVDQKTFVGIRFYLKTHDDLHHSDSDNDESAVTFWAPYKKLGGNQLQVLKDIFEHALDELITLKGEQVKGLIS
jgi:hypothetical protein